LGIARHDCAMRADVQLAYCDSDASRKTFTC
jgi:hypothetical protein